jgi:hypothetical protein
METSLEHPILGKLILEPNLSWWRTNVRLKDADWIDFCIDTDEPDAVSVPLDRAVEYLDWARTTESECRNKIADDLLATYNEIWAEDNVIGQISREIFINKIVPESLILHLDGEGTWYYQDSDLFAGHSIEILIEADRSFNEAHLAG